MLILCYQNLTLQNFNAKLSPRGLARLTLSNRDTDVTTHSAATLCYAAPERVKSGEFPLFSSGRYSFRILCFTTRSHCLIPCYQSELNL